MECIRPLRASFDGEGRLSFSEKSWHKENEVFEFPCRKCIPCRANQASEKATRAWHESQMHEDSIFLTLTYKDPAPVRLQYRDFQLFMKRLRKTRPGTVISYLVTGEYGPKCKRPHYHALIFGYGPRKRIPIRKNENGDMLYTSPEIEKLWSVDNKPLGTHDFGEVTLQSANYVARYALKKLDHGKDQDHDFHPIHKTGSKHALGKTWIQKYWKQTFAHGYVLSPENKRLPIPRYYEEWFKKTHPQEYLNYYVTEKEKRRLKAAQKLAKEEYEYQLDFYKNQHSIPVLSRPPTKTEVRLEIMKQKIKRLKNT